MRRSIYVCKSETVLGVHIGVYQPWYSVLFSNTWYKWQWGV